MRCSTRSGCLSKKTIWKFFISSLDEWVKDDLKNKIVGRHLDPDN